jgi:hypothetical protein
MPTLHHHGRRHRAEGNEARVPTRSNEKRLSIVWTAALIRMSSMTPRVGPENHPAHCRPRSAVIVPE